MRGMGLAWSLRTEHPSQSDGDLWEGLWKDFVPCCFCRSSSEPSLSYSPFTASLLWGISLCLWQCWTLAGSGRSTDRYSCAPLVLESRLVQPWAWISQCVASQLTPATPCKEQLSHFLYLFFKLFLILY